MSAQLPTTHRMRCPATEWHALHLANLKAMAGQENRTRRQVYIGLCFAFNNKLIARWVRDDFAAWYAGQR